MVEQNKVDANDLAAVINHRLSWASLHWFTIRTRGGIKTPVISDEVAPALAAAVEAAGWVNPAHAANLVAELTAAQGDSPAGFMSQREWEDWSNDLSELVPEGDEATYANPEGAQEAILLDVFTAYVRERDELKAQIQRIEDLADWHDTKADKARRFRPEIDGENRVMDKAAEVHEQAAARIRDALKGGVSDG